MIKTAAALLLSLSAITASAASRIVPAEPSARDAVDLRMTVDSCTFNPLSVHVTLVANVFKVAQLMNACLVAGTPQLVDVRLGTLPPGDYRVEVIVVQPANNVLLETLSFRVRQGVETTTSPVAPYPLTDYSGLWWNAQESGWGLSLHQSPDHAMFGALYVYGPSSTPEWYTLQRGFWANATTWTGTLYRTTGPFFAATDYDPRLLQVLRSGSATLDFSLTPGAEGRARFTYTVNGVTVTKMIVRMPF